MEPMLGYPFDVLDVLRRSQPPVHLSATPRRQRVLRRSGAMVVVLVLLGIVVIGLGALTIADATYGGDPVGAVADRPQIVTPAASEQPKHEP
jgi:hypothetical protein